MIDAGERYERPGRKFDYTDKDFFEAYFGKDYARNMTLNIDNSHPIFGFNETWKDKYPIDKYLLQPKIDAKE